MATTAIFGLVYFQIKAADQRSNRLILEDEAAKSVNHSIDELKYAFEVRRVPPQTEPGAASAFSQSPSLDGSRPGIVYFNLHDSAEWPKWALSTTVFHEGLPGHQCGILDEGRREFRVIAAEIGDVQ